MSSPIKLKVLNHSLNEQGFYFSEPEKIYRKKLQDMVIERLQRADVALEVPRTFTPIYL